MMRGKFRLPLAAILVFLLLGMAGQVHAQVPGWTVKTVITTAGVGDCSVTRLDAQSNPRILYYNATLKSLFYIQWNGSAWSKPLEVDPARAGHMLCSGGMVLRSTGQPAVVYVTDDARLFYARLAGSAFQLQEISLPLTGAMHSPNLVLGTGESPLIVLAQNNNLVYVYPSVSGWQFERPAKNAAGDLVLIGEHSPINILRDSQGNLHLSYYCMKHFPWYLVRTAAGFKLPVRMDTNAMTVNDTRPSVALALDTAEQPHVSATVGPNAQLKLYSRTCTGTTCTWTGQVLDQLPDSAATSEISGVRMAYDPFGRLLLTYYYRSASGTAGLRLLSFNGQSWSKKMIDNRVDYGRRAWLEINGPGQASVSYYAGGAGGLVFATGGTFPLPSLSNQFYLTVIGR